ncbi:phosphopantetheine-binding protein [Streptomyces dysideae]|uniref:Carrier domain-containing protein n=1 Tax=Streptomyces dysideae TaxID=909626 RepID=A0A101UTX0_9ACTN|nr:phosphopantetheine-binding protein [Streptomyces dysideae]KUO16795.1 hypothetical protein AQJ91_34075 [Streptomyces dysideae]
MTACSAQDIQNSCGISNMPNLTEFTELRARIADIWRDLFAEPDMRIEDSDNFFALGASSLLAMRMATAVAEQCGVPLTVLTVAENPTLAGLAEQVRELAAAEGAREVGEL